jgi:hypothetical protein
MQKIMNRVSERRRYTKRQRVKIMLRFTGKAWKLKRRLDRWHSPLRWVTLAVRVSAAYRIMLVLLQTAYVTLSVQS